MKILDTSALNFIFDNNVTLLDDITFYMTEDLLLEAETTALVKDKKLPSCIKIVDEHPLYNGVEYYKNYQEMLNKHNKRSFSNMTGFGDISILALVKTVSERIKNLPVLMPELTEKIEIYLSDGPLKDKLNKEFSNDSSITTFPSNQLQ
jgi:hypothetical protein